MNDPQPLPENWGPIFGMAGIADKLGDLSWLGKEFKDKGWFVVDDRPLPTITSTPEDIARETAKRLLAESDWTMLPDVPMTKGEKQLWIEYRRKLREIHLDVGYPNNIVWPNPPTN